MDNSRVQPCFWRFNWRRNRKSVHTYFFQRNKFRSALEPGANYPFIIVRSFSIDVCHHYTQPGGGSCGRKNKVFFLHTFYCPVQPVCVCTYCPLDMEP